MSVIGLWCERFYLSINTLNYKEMVEDDHVYSDYIE